MFQFGRVSEGAPQTGIAHYLNPDLFSQSALQQFGHPIQQPIYIDRLWIKGLAT
jgi:hypothetical protein